jgi:hypothetical protein
VNLFRGVIEAPNFIPIDVLILGAGVLGLGTVSLGPLYDSIITRSNSVASLLSALPTNSAILINVDSGDLANFLSFYREEILIYDVLIPLVAMRFDEIVDKE